MDVISLSRELGAAIQADPRYSRYLEAKDLNDKDEELQKLISEFNLGRMQLNQEMSKKENKSEDKIAELNQKIRALYGQIMTNKNMSAYNEAKGEMDRMLDQINNIITLSANGEDPYTCPAEHQCTGSCSTCGGCH